MSFENNLNNNFTPNRYKRDQNDGPENPGRRKFIKNALLIGAGGIVAALLGQKIFSDIEEQEISRIPIERHLLKKLRPDLCYVKLWKEPIVEGLVLMGKLNKSGYLEGSNMDILDGRIIRSLRYQNITEAAEVKYNLPHNTLLAMVAQETYGYNPLLNALGDGGVGLCHMQGMTAMEYGLRTYKDCNALVCDGKSKYSCTDEGGNKFNHGSDLKELVREENNDIKKLIDYDDRFHPVINIDAAARMIAFHMAGSSRDGIGPIETAMERYSGRDSYWEKIKALRDYFNDKIYLKKVEERFNVLNSRLTIDSKKIGFVEYIKEFQKQNLNYELDTYKSSTKYLPKNSEMVLKNLRYSKI